MPDFTLNPKQTIELDKAVASVNVHIGTALVSLPGEVERPHFLDAGGDDLDCENKAPVVIYSPDSAVLDVTYTEEVKAGTPAAPHGDTGGGNSGSFESRTVPQLKAEVKERGLEVTAAKKGKPTKAELIAALREG